MNISMPMKAPAMRFEVLMKPTAMSKRKGNQRRPEYVTTVFAFSKEEAIRIARERSAIEGFNGYAITRLKELK